MFEPVCAKETCRNYSVGSDQDEIEIQFGRFSTQEWCTCEKCEKKPTVDQFRMGVLSGNSGS